MAAASHVAGRAIRAVVFTAATLAASTAWADADGDEEATRRKDAQGLFTQGLRAAEAGDNLAALGAFRAAYDRYPSFRVLYNVGQLCQRLGDAACAVRAYEKYIRDGGADVPAARRQAVESEIRKLSKSTATVKISANVDGAEVKIDEEVVGRTPFAAPVAVNAGAHTIVLTYEGRSVDAKLKVASGDRKVVELEVQKDDPKPVAEAPAEESEPAQKPPPADRPRKFPVVPWAVTGGFAVATVVTGVLAASAYSTFQEKRDAFPVTRDELDDAQGSARDLFLLTGLFGTITVVSAGVAGYFTFLAPADGRPAASSAPRVAMGLGPRGVVLSGVLP